MIYRPNQKIVRSCRPGEKGPRVSIEDLRRYRLNASGVFHVLLGLDKIRRSAIIKSSDKVPTLSTFTTGE